MPTTDDRTPVFYHPDQLLFRPLVEWERGKEVAHPETPERLQRILEAVDRRARTFKEPEKLASYFASDSTVLSSSSSSTWRLRSPAPYPKQGK